MIQGELVQWNDARGFGFIAGADGKRYFVHISDIARIATRPRLGDTVRFIPLPGKDGRPAAKSVSIDGANPLSGQWTGRGAPSRSGSRWNWRFALAFLLAAGLLIAVLRGQAPPLLAAGYVLMGFVSLLLYRADKTAAENGQWRISEAMLLGLDMAFGIIGGLMAQSLLRHKTRKQSYVATSLVIALVHAMWLVGMAGGWIGLDEIGALLAV